MKLVSFENLSKYNELLSQKTVRSVNSIKPDSNGNVTLEIPQAIGVTRFPDYENPITVYDIANKGIKENVNFDYTFTEDGYLHYRLISDSRQDYDAIFGGLLIVNNSVVNLYERSRSPAVSGIHACINEIIPVQKGSTIHIDQLQCCADSHNIIEFFPLKNGNAIQADEVTGVVKSVNSIAPDENGNVQIDISDADLSGVVKSVNSIAPDASGNVLLGTEKSTFNKVVYDTGYFSISTAKTYSFDLTGSDRENVSKENVNVRLVAKVTTAHSGFEVGDIAQLSLGLDYTGFDKPVLDVGSYISGNTLHIRSGNSPVLSVYSNGQLEKANVQIKAVLTAFVPDDGSILLIAEDQTNTSKLIGLPDGTLTWKDKNLVRSVNGVDADASGNVTVSGDRMPDYASGIRINIPYSSSRYTVPFDCVFTVSGHFYSGKSVSAGLYINGRMSNYTWLDDEDLYCTSPTSIFLHKGDVIYFNTSFNNKASVIQLFLYPLI